MFDITDENTRKFCQPVIGVEYIVGKGIRRNVSSIDTCIDLALLYYEGEYSEGNEFIELLFDDNGKQYARLTEDGVNYARMNTQLFIARKKKSVGLDEAKTLPDEHAENKIIDSADLDNLEKKVETSDHNKKDTGSKDPDPKEYVRIGKADGELEFYRAYAKIRCTYLCYDGEMKAFFKEKKTHIMFLS